ncbi:MAG TPA: hypothetical protein VJ905_10390, partial [Halalkalibaculum sp.]|nr:hypothetical protein [Halalkalibaculum sp.]
TALVSVCFKTTDHKRNELRESIENGSEVYPRCCNSRNQCLANSTKLAEHIGGEISINRESAKDVELSFSLPVISGMN